MPMKLYFDMNSKLSSKIEDAVSRACQVQYYSLVYVFLGSI